MNKQLRMNEGIYRLLSEPAGVLAFKRTPEATEKRTVTDGKKTLLALWLVLALRPMLARHFPPGGGATKTTTL